MMKREKNYHHGFMLEEIFYTLFVNNLDRKVTKITLSQTDKSLKSLIKDGRKDQTR